MNNRIITALLCIGLCMLFAFAGSLFVPVPGSWYYTTLVKPSWNPPDWVFAPAWTVLFTMMGIALSMVLKDGVSRPEVRYAGVLFLVQLFLNLGWSALFFGLQSPLYGFVEIVVLWISILMTILAFMKVSSNAALLLVPYILWVSFASYLNLTILRMNP